jgi:hypothetical protein
MNIGEKVEANPGAWLARAAVGGFVLCLTLLGVLPTLFGLKLVWEGSYLTKDDVEERYVSRAVVEDRYVARAEYAECRRTMNEIERAAEQCEEHLATGEPEHRELAPTSTVDHAPGKTSQGRGEASGSETPRGETQPTSTGAKQTFQSQWFEFEVVSLEVGSEDITMLAEVRSKHERSVELLVNRARFILLDYEGYRWNASSDTLGLVTISAPVELLPGVALRSRIQFRRESGSGSTPDPQPPFTLMAHEIKSGERIVIQGLQAR